MSSSVTKGVGIVQEDVRFTFFVFVWVKYELNACNFELVQLFFVEALKISHHSWV